MVGMFPVGYLSSLITEAITTTFVPRSGRTVDGYTTKRGAHTRYKVRIVGSTNWYRVYCYQISNVGTCFIRCRGVPIALHGWQEDRIKVLAKEWELTKAHEAALSVASDQRASVGLASR